MTTDIEKTAGLGSANTPPKHDSATSSRDISEPFHTHRELEVFQALVGIHFLDAGGVRATDKSHWKSKLQVKPASPILDIFRPSKTLENGWRNRGLYDRALSQDLRNRILYTLSRYIIAGLFILQVLLSATITAIAAYHDTGTVALTTLGAINTVVAGLLAYITGQGMPVRFRRARDQYRELVRAIEKTERMFSEIDLIRWDPGQRPHPITERDRLEKQYEDALKDQEQNYPEAQNNPQQNNLLERNEELQERVMKEKIAAERERADMRKEAEAAAKEYQDELEELQQRSAAAELRYKEMRSKLENLKREELKAMEIKNEIEAGILDAEERFVEMEEAEEEALFVKERAKARAKKSQDQTE